MVDAATGAGGRSKDWGFHEEPPTQPLTTGSTGARPNLGWSSAPHVLGNERAGAARPLLLDVSAFTSVGLTRAPAAPSPFETVTGSRRTFADSESLGAEIFRLKDLAVAPRSDDALRAAVRQQVLMRQAEWVMLAKREGRPEPTGPLDLFRATPAEVANAFLWSEAGGVVPRDELARDGGRAFQESIRDAVVLRTRGFDAVLALHAGHPDEQRALLSQELTRRGVHAPSDASPEVLGALYRKSILDEESHRRTMGLDGRSGTADSVDAYERDQVVAAMHPGTTLGSLLATYSTVVTGNIDIDHMRAGGTAGEALEGALGGVGVHTTSVALEREHPLEPKPTLDDFNRSGMGETVRGHDDE